MIHCRRPQQNEILAFVPEAKPDVTSQPEPQQTQEAGESEATLQDKAQEVVSEVTGDPTEAVTEVPVAVATSVATEEPVTTTVIATLLLKLKSRSLPSRKILRFLVHRLRL